MTWNSSSEKKIEGLILDMDGRNVWINLKGPEALLIIDGMKMASFKRFSPVLAHLIRHRNQFISADSLREKASPDTVSDCIYEIRKLFKDCGLAAPLEAAGRGNSYQVCFHVSGEEVLYGDDYEAYETDLMAGGSTSVLSAERFTGGQEILTDYLPGCQANFQDYPTLASYVLHDFMNEASSGSLIVSSVGGGGKTFSLCHTYQQALERNIPAFFVRADALEEIDQNLLHHIARTFLNTPSYQDHPVVLDQFIRQVNRPVLILVDGLNEVSAQKQSLCCASFLWMQKEYPQQIFGVFTTRFPQTIKARLPKSAEAQLKALPLLKFSAESQSLLSRLHAEATPLIRRLLESMDISRLEQIGSRYELYTLYFETLMEKADQDRGEGWIYHVLSYIASCSMEGDLINNRWLKTLCSDRGDYDFIHRWAGSEEVPLEEPAAADKIKASGFLTKSGFDTYDIHQQIRDCLAIRYSMLRLHCGDLSPLDFADKLIDATRYYTVSDGESRAEINLRRHNNMDFGEFGFYALLDWYHSHPQDQTQALAIRLTQLGIQVAYLFDNVQNRYGLYALHRQLEDFLTKCFRDGLSDQRLFRSIPGYCFCLNKLVTVETGIDGLSSQSQLLAFSSMLEQYYEGWIQSAPEVLKQASDSERQETEAAAESGLGGVYLARWRITDDYALRIEYLSHAIKHHTRAKDLRLASGSPKLHISYSALGSVSYYKAQTYLSSPAGRPLSEAANLFEIAAANHQKALEQESNQERYVSLTRMAGCYRQLYQIACIQESEESVSFCRSKLLSAVRESIQAIIGSAAENGAFRHGSEIRALLLEISSSMAVLPLEASDFEAVKQICQLYHDAFPYEKKPYCSADNTRILFV